MLGSNYPQILQRIRKKLDATNLPEQAKAEIRRDKQGLPSVDPGIDSCVSAAVKWLGLAQARSASRDGGAARDYSLIKGWATSYPETTGYIIPTLLSYSTATGSEKPRLYARGMLDWLVSIQLEDGSFQGGKIDSQPVVPVVFNTGQILMGLAAGTSILGDAYREAMVRAADWLVAIQDSDGCWRKYGSPFAGPGEKTYDTHVAWGLMEAHRVEPNRGYAEAALRNVKWALSHQRSNGWFDRCCLDDASQPLTHTIGYVLRGVLEGYRLSEDRGLLSKAILTADSLLHVMDSNGYIPGRLNSDWKGTVSWSCLTGTVQIAYCWLALYQVTKRTEYRDAAYKANKFVRKTVRIDGPAEIRGGVKGSFPVDGGYGTFEYLNWACKFFIDSNLFEKQVRASEK